MKTASTWKDRCEHVRGELVAIIRFIQHQPELRNMLDTVVLVVIVLFVTGGF
ncbi:hypothetical protein D3C78_1927170 [compost metagenome]